MDFFLLDVKSTVNINGKDIAFDYINTYFDLDEALKKAKSLESDNNVLSVSVHRWLLNDDGTQEHSEDEFIDGVRNSSIPYNYTNMNHREWK